MAPAHAEENSSLRDAVASVPQFKYNDIVNRVNKSKLLFTAMGTALYHDEGGAEEHEGFYRLQKLKRTSTANLRSMNERKGKPETDNLLCLPVEDKFVTSLDVLEELSEPNTSCSSLSEPRETSISGDHRILSFSSRSRTPLQPPTQSKPDFSTDHRIAQSQDRINRLLKELEPTRAGSESHHWFVSDILNPPNGLRLHFHPINHIATRLEPPTDKWSVFVHYMAFLGTTVLDDAVPDALEEVDRARAGAIAQLSHSLDLWRPQPAGPRRWIIRMQQACNVWQCTLDDLQVCRFKGIGSSLLDPQDREELRKVMGMEDLARALCNHAARFGHQWDENHRKFLGGNAGMGSIGNHETERREPICLREEPSIESYVTSRSQVSSGQTIIQKGSSQIASPQENRLSLVEHKAPGDSFHTLMQDCNSMPNLHPDHQWHLGLSYPIPERSKVSDRSSTVSKQLLEKSQAAQNPTGPTSLEEPSTAKTSGNNLDTSNISQFEIKPSERTPLDNTLDNNSPSRSHRDAGSSRNTFTIGSESSHPSEEPSVSHLQEEDCKQSAPMPFIIRGERLPSPHYGQSWERKSSEGTSSKASNKSKYAWNAGKKFVKEHQESANAAVVVHYGQGGSKLEAPETPVDGRRASTDNLTGTRRP